ncbi:MAG: DUF2726 domain-containing protein [Clostridiales bacterium]|nr:DUF2726 domain-containing protein [Clostridiales bacterium]
MIRYPQLATITAATLTAAVILSLFLLALFLLWLLRGRHLSQDSGFSSFDGEYPYEPRALLTEREAQFYQALRPVAARYTLHLLSKVRVADFIGVCAGLEKADYRRFFSKIQAKHVDFILSDPDTLEPVLLIEVDDSTHDTVSRQERDDFLDSVYCQAEIPILHIRELDSLEQEVSGVLEEIYQF